MRLPSGFPVKYIIFYAAPVVKQNRCAKIAMNILSFTPMPPISTERNDKFMPAYYNEESKKWYCKFYYKDWQGNRKQKKKSGFERKKDALEWERSFLDKLSGSPDMAFSDMVELYLEDKKKHVKLKTYLNHKDLFRLWILPYFKNKAINDITAIDIRQWEATLKESTGKKGTLLSSSYMNNILAKFSGLFNFAVRFYGLPSNPCKLAGNLVGKMQKSLNFWTKEEFDRFISTFDKSDPFYAAFLTLYYTGMRIGELQALTLADLDLENGIIHINKTYAIISGQEIITTPKTTKSVREIYIPAFLCKLLKKHIKRYYKPQPDTRVFQMAKETYRNRLVNHSEKAGVKRIRLHDIRHSHASLLIDLNFSVLMISERLGHEDPSITLKTYAHLFPTKQNELVERLDEIFNK